MAKSVSEGIISGLRGYREGQDSQRKRMVEDSQMRQFALEDAVKRADLTERGFEVTPKGNQFQLTRSEQFSAPTGFIRVGSKYEKDPSYVSPLEQAKIDNYKAKQSQGILTPGQRTAKDKATAAIYETVEANKVRRQQIADAEKALPKVPQGIGGQISVAFKKRFQPNDPMLEDWQKIKMIGTDAALLQTAKTKGAISDYEMKLLQESAANDDILSAPRLKPVIKKMVNALNAQEAGMFGSYKQNYNEDPQTWFQQEGGGEVPEWVPEGYESDYGEARRRGASDDQIKNLLLQRGIL